MGDYAHEQIDRRLEEIEKRLAKEYARAEKEIGEKVDDYFRRFQYKDEKWRQWVYDGERTKEEYLEWRKGQMIVGRRWKTLKREVAETAHNTNLVAREIIAMHLPEAYAINHNWGTYQIEHDSLLDTNYTLYDEQAIARMMMENPRMLPRPGAKTMRDIYDITKSKDMLWNQEQVQSVAFQAIVQGKSIPEITKDIEKRLGERNHKAAIRNARTMMTGAQNGGRIDSYKRAQSMGIDLRKCWVATLDMRTRHAHRVLDGQSVDVGKPFEVEGEKIRFPGDPEAPGHLVYNCRCTLISQIKGFEIDTKAYRKNPDIGNMSYEEWKNSRKERHNPITLPEDKRNAIIGAYIAEYKE